MDAEIAALVFAGVLVFLLWLMIKPAPRPAEVGEELHPARTRGVRRGDPPVPPKAA